MREFLLAGILFFGALPSTSNYQLQSFGFGSGGTANSSTTTYSLEGSSGEVSGTPSSTTNYTVNPGYTQTQQANVPQLSALDNNGGILYNQLHFVIDTQGNPSDATYLVSVSTDNFVTNTTYLQPDGTLSSTLSTSDYQTYSYFGGSSGSYIIGLLPSTTYYLKVLVTNGKFSESQYGPVSSQATGSPSLTFSLDTSSQPTPPYSIGLGNLPTGTVTTSSQTINTIETTNAAFGGNVYITGANGGLYSASTSNLIPSTSTNLDTSTNGFGAQSTLASATSGSWSAASPYNNSGNIVGSISNTTSSLYSSSSPVTAGIGNVVLKAKSAASDSIASDYSETITFTAAASF